MGRAISRDLVDAISRADLRAFLQAMFPIYAPGQLFVPGWYIDAIAYHLELVAAGIIKRLIINMPPRYLKSYCASVAFPAWLLGRDPTQQIMCVSYANDLVRKHANDFRNIVQSEKYRRLFPSMKISRNKNTELETETTRRGFRIGASTEGGITGRGAGILIIDDPISANDANSLAAMEKTSQWFKNTAYSRLNDKRNDAIVIVMQRLHVDDLSGELMRNGGWTVLSLPAIANEDQIVKIGPGLTHLYRCGEALHPEREPLDVLRETERVLSPSVFSAQYLQQPLPSEGQLIKRDWFRVYDNAPARNQDTFVFQSWDTASKLGRHNDYSVGITFQRQVNDYYILDVHRSRMDFPTLRQMAVAKYKQYKASTMLIEDASSGIQLLQDLKSTGVLFPIPYKPAHDKRLRVMQCQFALEQGRVHLPREAPWLRLFIDELVSFPSSHDDQVDAFTMGILWAESQFRIAPKIGLPLSISKSGVQSAGNPENLLGLEGKYLPGYTQEITHGMYGREPKSVAIGLGPIPPKLPN